jgi:hypothetical protein
MVDVSAIAGAVNALKAAKDVIEAMIGMRDDAAFREKQLELQSKMLDAHNAIFAVNDERAQLINKIAALENQIAEMNDWNEEKQRYKRVSIGRLVSAYVLNEVETPNMADHWLCANCFDGRRKSHLQQVPISTGRATVVACPTCKSVNYLQGQALQDHAPILSQFTR